MLLQEQVAAVSPHTMSWILPFQPGQPSRSSCRVCCSRAWLATSSGRAWYLLQSEGEYSDKPVE